MFRQPLVIAAIAVLFCTPSLGHRWPAVRAVRQEGPCLGREPGTLVVRSGRDRIPTTDTRRCAPMVVRGHQAAADSVRRPGSTCSPTRTRADSRLGADRTFRFEVVEGAVSPDLVSFLLRADGAIRRDRGDASSSKASHCFARTSSTSVEGQGARAIWRVPEAPGVCHGTRDGESALALRRPVCRAAARPLPPRSRSRTRAAAGETRTYVFELKTEMPRRTVSSPRCAWGATTSSACATG